MAEEQEERGAPGWLIVAIVVAFGLSVRAFANSPEDIKLLATGFVPEAAGSLTGHATFYVLLVFAILYFAVLRRRAPGKGGKYFAFLLVSVLALDAAGIGLLIWVGNRAVAGDEAKFNAFMLDVRRAVVSSGTSDSPVADVPVNATGMLGEAERLAKDMVFKLREDAVVYRRAVHDQDFPAFVSPPRLAARHGLDEARERLAKIRAVLAQTRRNLTATVGNFPTAVAHANFSDDVKQQMTAGFYKGVSDSAASSEAIFDCEDGILAEYEKLVDDLSHAHGRWQLQDGSLAFANATDIANFNGHVRAIQALATKEKALSAAANAHVDSELGAGQH